MSEAHFDIDYAVVRAAKQHGRNTGVKVVRLALDEDGKPTGKVTLRNGRGENRGSFTVAEGKTTIHKAPVKKERKAAVEAESTDDE